MNDFLSQLIHSGHIIPLGAIALGSLIAIVSIAGGFWYKVRHAEIEAALKHKMLDQGMSADDIKKVLAASSGSDSAKDCANIPKHKI